MVDATRGPKWPLWIWGLQAIPSCFLLSYGIWRLASSFDPRGEELRSYLVVIVGALWLLASLVPLFRTGGQVWLISRRMEWGLSAATLIACLVIGDIALTVLEAIGRAGDVTENSDMTNVTLTRENVTYDINLLAMYEYGDLTQNVVLQHGDVLSIPDRNLQKVFVLGAVASPSTQIMHKGRLTLAEALSDAGGLNEKEA